ncbi:hypothetical protein PIB30_117731 [Stylosanthes scabra]|uniref:Secreted protein n=1 Tax=Stylosanthes scabra TaxID=79078 RepID=A0ABU6XF97_9FABA|nr:hypothetical protein [Stylosanthes scabra]
MKNTKLSLFLISIFPQISREESLIAVTETKERNPNPHPHVRRRFGQNNHLLNQKIAKKKDASSSRTNPRKESCVVNCNCCQTSCSHCRPSRRSSISHVNSYNEREISTQSKAN